MSFPTSPSFPGHPIPAARDTKAWSAQVWISFSLAVGLCATGLGTLPGAPLERAFMAMGYLFCLSAAFVLAKFVRDRQAGQSNSATSAVAAVQDTPMWRLVVWGGFGAAMALTGWGLAQMQISPTYKAFLAVSWLFLISSAFTLAKLLRDRHEADLADAWQWGRHGALVDVADAGHDAAANARTKSGQHA